MIVILMMTIRIAVNFLKLFVIQIKTHNSSWVNNCISYSHNLQTYLYLDNL